MFELPDQSAPLPPAAIAQAVSHLPDGFVIADARLPGNPIVSVNPAFEGMTGYRPDEMLGRSCSFLQGDDRDQPELSKIRAGLAAGRPAEAILRNYTKNGRLFHNHLRIAPIRDPDGEISHFVGIQRNVTTEVQLRRQLVQRNATLRAAVGELKRAALTDPLTGLGNRRAFAARLDASWAECARTGQPLSALMIDVDWFKNYNDHYGHPAGDAALTRVAEVIGSTLRRGTDFAARYGGEEFALIGPGIRARRAGQVAAKLCRRVERLRLLHGASPLGQVTVSVGHATVYADAAVSPASLVKMADEALYEAKQAGRNRCAAAGRPGGPSAVTPEAA